MFPGPALRSAAAGGVVFSPVYVNTFTGANGTNVSANPADVAPPGLGGWFTFSGGFTIQNNRAYGNDGEDMLQLYTDNVSLFGTQMPFRLRMTALLLPQASPDLAPPQSRIFGLHCGNSLEPPYTTIRLCMRQLVAGAGAPIYASFFLYRSTEDGSGDLFDVEQNFEVAAGVEHELELVASASGSVLRVDGSAVYSGPEVFAPFFSGFNIAGVNKGLTGVNNASYISGFSLERA